MKITFILARVDLSGGSRVVAIYAERLRKRGHEVVIVSRPSRTPTLREKARSLLRGRPLPAVARESPTHLDNVSVEHHIVDRHRAITAADVPDADVVIATWWETAEWVARFPASKGAKVYFIQHYEAHGGMPAERVDKTWRLPMHKIVIARWLEDLARDRFGDHDAALVPNSVDLEQFAVPPHSKQPVTTIGVMYSIVQWKGCDISLRAFELAAAARPGLRLVSFGTREPTAALALPAGAEFVCQPDQSRIKDFYASCDAWLFASRSEGFGLPILESMACRTPVIATPAGAAPELVGEGGGLLVPHEDPAAMAAAIEQICRMPNAQWREMSDKAYATASRYSWEDATDRFEQALRSALAQQNRATPARATA